MIIRLNPTEKQLVAMMEATKVVKTGECAEGCGEMWLCHEHHYDGCYMDKCLLCDIHQCDIPCEWVSCSREERDDEKEVYFTNYK